MPRLRGSAEYAIEQLRGAAGAGGRPRRAIGGLPGEQAGGSCRRIAASHTKRHGGGDGRRRQQVAGVRRAAGWRRVGGNRFELDGSTLVAGSMSKALRRVFLFARARVGPPTRPRPWARPWRHEMRPAAVWHLPARDVSGASSCRHRHIGAQWVESCFARPDSGDALRHLGVVCSICGSRATHAGLEAGIIKRVLRKRGPGRLFMIS